MGREGGGKYSHFLSYCRSLSVSYRVDSLLRIVHLMIKLNQLAKMTNKMKLCRILYCFLTALHVLSGIFAHHQEHLNCIYSFWFYSHLLLLAHVKAE